MDSSSETLPNLISELMSSKCDGDRLRTRTRFEQNSEILDSKLNHLIKSHNSDLSGILENTSKAIQVVAASKEKCRALKERIISCKESLQCKRDDLRRLWLESLEHKCVYQLLEEIRRLKKIPATVNDHLTNKQYLKATEVLVSSLSILEGELNDIEGLKNLKCELHRLIDRLYSIFLDELTQELYMSTFHTVFQGNDIGCEEVTYEKVFSSEIVKNSTKSIDFNVAYVTTLLECMSLMGKIPETVEILKEECPNELMKIVHKLSKYMYDIVQKSTDAPVLDLPVKQGELFLLDLLETIIGHFRQISLNSKTFLHVLGKSSFFNGFEEVCYQMADVYSNIQATIEYFVTNYLEIQPVSTLPRQNLSVFSNSQNVGDLSDFFLPKNYADNKSVMLFKFRNSSLGLIGNRKKVTYDNLRETEVQLCKGAGDNNAKKLTLVCKPSLRNITFIFEPLKIFVSEIESALDIESGGHCPLHAFIFDCANNFLDQVNSEINRILENASLNLESWSVSTIPDSTSEGERSEKQILTSTVILNDNLKELQKLLSNLPDYSNHFLQLIYYVILDYKDLVHKIFKSLFDEEQNILSVSWAKDRDIRRLLKSFSNWKFLSVAESGEIIESPEDIRLRNKEESELLIRNLHSEEHESWEIINDCTILFNLAILQESLQWFSSQLLAFVEDFKFVPQETSQQERPEGAAELHALNAATGLKKLAKEYEDFSDVCLLALHLEVRAHCFQHLLSNQNTQDDPREAWETSIKNLTGDLMKIDETLVLVLSPKEMKYVFEGLGELIASILIHSVSNMTKVDEYLVKQMHRGIFAIQCCLSNITMTREVSLERARQYIQLLNQTCDEILNDILEDGPMFKEYEYASILRFGSDPQMLPHFETKLQEIFKRISTQASQM